MTKTCKGHECSENFSVSSQLKIRAPELSVALEGSKASAFTQKMDLPGDNVGLGAKLESLKHPLLNTVPEKNHLELPRGFLGPQ